MYAFIMNESLCSACLKLNLTVFSGWCYSRSSSWRLQFFFPLSWAYFANAILLEQTSYINLKILTLLVLCCDQIVAITVFFLLTIAYYAFFAPFVSKEVVFEYVAIGGYTFLVRYDPSINFFVDNNIFLTIGNCKMLILS